MSKRRRLLDETGTGTGASSHNIIGTVPLVPAPSSRAAGPPVPSPPAGAAVAMAVTPTPGQQQQQQHVQKKQGQQKQEGPNPISDPPPINRRSGGSGPGPDLRRFPPHPSPSPTSTSTRNNSRPLAVVGSMASLMHIAVCCCLWLLISGTSGASAQPAQSQSLSSSSLRTTYTVEIPAFRLILRPVATETFTAAEAQSVLSVAEDVAKSYIDHALERTSYASAAYSHHGFGNGNRAGGGGGGLNDMHLYDVRVEDVTLEYMDWFSYNRRLDAEQHVLHWNHHRKADTTSNANSNAARSLQGGSDYAVIESALPIGGTVTFSSTLSPAASSSASSSSATTAVGEPTAEAAAAAAAEAVIPTSHDTYLLLTYAFFPEGMTGDDNDGGAGGGGGAGLVSALVNRLGYPPSLAGTFFAVDEDFAFDGDEGAEDTTGSTEQDESEGEVLVIPPLPPGSTSADAQPADTAADINVIIDNDVFQTTATEGGERDNPLVQSTDPPSGGGIGDSKDTNTATNTKNSAALATGIVLGCLAVLVMGAYYVRYSSRRKYYKEDRYSWDDDLADEEQGGGGGEYGIGGADAAMVTPTKGKGEGETKSKAKSKSQPDDDDDDDEDSHRTAPMTPMMPMTPEASTSQAATAAAAAPSAKANGSVGVDQIVSDLTRDEAELQNLRRQNSLDQHQHQDQDQIWLSDGLRQPSATGVEPATGDAGDLAAVATTLFVAADFGAGGEVLDGDRIGFQEPTVEEGGEEDSSSSASADSHDESSTGEEEATVTSLAAVSITSSDASAFNGNRNTSMTIMKDQLVGSGGGDPFGETGHPSQGAGGGAISPMVPVPSVNFSSFKRREKNIHLRPNCLTVEGVVGTNAAAIAPEPDDDDNDDVDFAEEASPLEDTPVQNSQQEEDDEGTSVASCDEPAEGDQDASSTNDDGMFIVSSPSFEEATNGRVSPILLDATPLNPALKLVEPKILTSIKASQESLSKLSGLPPAISEDNAQLDPAPSASSPKGRSPQFLPTPAPLKDIGRDTSLDRTVDFDAVDWNHRDGDGDDDDDESTTSSACSVNNPFDTPDNMQVNEEEILMESTSSPKKASYQMESISNSSFDYEGSSFTSTGSPVKRLAKERLEPFQQATRK